MTVGEYITEEEKERMIKKFCEVAREKGWKIGAPVKVEHCCSRFKREIGRDVEFRYDVNGWEYRGEPIDECPWCGKGIVWEVGNDDG